MTEFRFEEIAGWIAEPVDPIELENWVGNKLLGIRVPANKKWEKAFWKWKLGRGEGMMADLAGFTDREKMEIFVDGVKPVGVTEAGDLGTVTAVAGKATAMKIGDGGKVKVLAGEILVLPAQGGKLTVFDARGRPLATPTVDTAGREKLLKWQKAWE